ncbi:unnamed protein product [Orchesella dallaii]|uniref:Uncharacterized protein n=1 Tax=Orchesella dallaii TaxID=48710 RepID=A0ABP1PQD7_9HEXA
MASGKLVAVDSKAAGILISDAMDVDTEVYDSDDCPSDVESENNIIGNVLGAEVRINNGEMKEARGNGNGNSLRANDFHKMDVIQDRPYQSELLKMAIERNVIICLPTGSGKTYIALKLAEHMLPSAIEKKQKIVFIANTVPLVNQQAGYFSANLINTAIQDDKYVRALTGDLNVDIWKEEEWDNVMTNYHILVMSTQILLDAITKAYVSWNQIALLILDECHHAQKSHPMALLMKNYGERRVGNDLSACGLPKVLGLTATIIIGNSKIEEIPKEINDIEKLLCCKAVTHRNYEEVLKYSTSTRFQIVTYNSTFKQTDPVCQDIIRFLQLLDKLHKNIVSDDVIETIQSIDHPSLTTEDQLFNKRKGVPQMLKTFLNDLLKTYEELGPYCAKLGAVVKMIIILKWIQQISNNSESDSSDEDSDYEISDNEDPVDAGVLLENVLTVLTSFMRRLESEMEAAVVRSIGSSDSVSHEAYIVRNCVSQKIFKLLEILRNKRPTNIIDDDDDSDELCGVVFCERRITANVLGWYLKKIVELYPDEYGFIRPEVMVGQSTLVTDTESARFTANRQAAVIRKFHAKELNILVATRVVEEGLDVPACNLIMRFDNVASYPSYVQSMGRARKRGAICYALIDAENETKEGLKLQSFKDFNKKLAEALEKNAFHVGEDEFESDNDIVDLIPPFCPKGPNGPKITATDAISIVHRYCSALSCDKIAALTPISWWRQIDGKKLQFSAFIQLPVLSPIRDIVEGAIMPDKTSAKRSAYLEACKLLYDANEFTDNLLPKPRSIDNYRCEFLDMLAEEIKPEKLTATRKVGTRGRIQQYAKQIPKIIEESRTVVPNEAASLYEVKIKIKNYTGDERAERLYCFKELGHSFGIITNAQLDNLPDFTLNANYGTFIVKVKKSKIDESGINLTGNEIGMLESFQHFLCDLVYEIKNPAVTSDRMHFLIAPLVGKSFNKTINWSLIRSCLDLDEENLLTKPNDDDRKRMNDVSQFDNALLVPWYKKPDQSMELLCSINIMKDSSALSEFDDLQKARTFQEYYARKYNVELFNPKLPLVVCKSVAKQLNFLTKKADGKERRKEIQRSIMKVIPELVNIHPFPASLFVQGRFLPSVLHRISRLLAANQIRQDVAKYFNWSVESIDERETMMPLNNSSVDELLSDMETEQDGYKDQQNVTLERTSPVTKKPKSRHPDSINPFTYTWNDFFDSEETKPKTYRDTKFCYPGPPIYKSDICLTSIDDVKFQSFDTETDFDKEKGPSIETVMEAFTLSNAQDNVSLEKLEVMGDSVLKIMVSLHVFRNFPTWDEGKMTLLRTKLISNLHLYQIGKKNQIGELLSGSFFIPDKNWLPLGMTIPKNFQQYTVSEDLDYDVFVRLRKSTVEEMKSMSSTDRFRELLEDVQGPLKKSSEHTNYTHSKIGDKSVADAVEALIGAYYMNGGIDGAIRIMEWLGLRAPKLDGSVSCYSRSTMLMPIESEEVIRKPKKQNIIMFLEDLEKVIQYKFKNPWLAVEALTHPTFIGNRETPCYERLEFVGDAVLDFLVTNYICTETKLTDPGKITDLRAALVNNVTFASLAVRYGLQTYLKYNSKTLADYISKFKAYQDEHNHEVGDPHKLYSDFDCPTVKEIEVPKVLGDIFESIAGAVFVDSGMSIDTTWKVFYCMMEKELVKFSKCIPKSPLRSLHEYYPGKVNFRKYDMDANPKNNKANSFSKYKVVYLQVPNCDEPIIGVGATIKEAKQAAAKYVVRTLKVGM